MMLRSALLKMSIIYGHRVGIYYAIRTSNLASVGLVGQTLTVWGIVCLSVDAHNPTPPPIRLTVTSEAEVLKS